MARAKAEAEAREEAKAPTPAKEKVAGGAMPQAEAGQQLQVPPEESGKPRTNSDTKSSPGQEAIGWDKGMLFQYIFVDISGHDSREFRF